MFNNEKMPDNISYMSLEEIAKDLDKKLKQEIHEFIKPKCIECGKPLKLGEFAYDQNTCWSCFEAKFKNIITFLNDEDKEIIAHLLAVTKEIHKI